LLAALLALAAGCRSKRPTLRPVGEPAARIWIETIDMPVLGLRVELRKGRELFRDDGLFKGDLNLHLPELRSEPGCETLAASGTASEGLLAAGTGADGVRRAAVWGLTTGDPAADRARREGLRAAAAIRLGRRAELENYFRSRGLRIQMRTVSDGVLAAMAELYALSLQGGPIRWAQGADREQAAQILMALGVGEK